MASLTYLFTNRAKFPTGTKSFFKAWTKRLFLFPELIKRNRTRSRLVTKGAIIHESAEIGTIKADGNKKNLTIDSNTFIGKIEIALHDKVCIGKNVCINDGVLLLTASHDLSDPEWKLQNAPITIEDYAWICTNAVILPGVTIGKGAVVGAGAVVSKNVEAFDIVAGNPGKSIGKKRIEELNYNPCEFLAANAAWLKG